jgi:hypothetical protein
MSLIGIKGKTGKVLNKALILYGMNCLPCLVIDCANCANPHAFYPKLSLETMQQIYVFELEQLYKFRDVLRQLPLYSRRLNAKAVVVTTSDHLINYQNEDENKGIYVYAWQLMRKIGRKENIIAGVLADSIQFEYAKKYCDKIIEVEKWDIQLPLKE